MKENKRTTKEGVGGKEEKQRRAEIWPFFFFFPVVYKLLGKDLEALNNAGDFMNSYFATSASQKINPKEECIHK